MTLTARAAHVALLLISGWLVIAPWPLDLADTPAATVVAITVGTALAAAVTATWLRPRNHWPRRGELLLAAFLYLSPWVFGYAGTPNAAPNAWMFSTIIGYAAIVQMVELRHVGRPVVDTTPDPRELGDDTPVIDQPAVADRAVAPGQISQAPVRTRPANARRKAPASLTAVTLRH